MNTREPSRIRVSRRGRSMLVRIRGWGSGAVVVVLRCGRATIAEVVVAVGAC